MKSLVIALSFVSAAPAFASSACITNLLQAGIFRDQAQALCNNAKATSCDVGAIMSSTGLNYASAIELCPRSYKSNADVNACVASGKNYSECK